MTKTVMRATTKMTTSLRQLLRQQSMALVLGRGHREHLRKRHKKVEREVGRILRACLVERQVQVIRFLYLLP